MIKFSELLKNRNKEEGSAFIFAILLLMIMVLTVVLITTTTITGSQTAMKLSTRDLLRQSAEAALNNALVQANQSSTEVLEARRGVGSAQLGSMTGTASSKSNINLNLKWKWYTQQVVFPGQKIGYYVYAVGYSDSPGFTDTVTLRAQFIPTGVSKASYNSVTKSAVYTLSNPWGVGMVGLNSVTVESGAKVYTADSFYGSIPSGTSSTGAIVATNNNIVLGNTTTGVIEANFNAPSTSGGGCAGAGCANTGITYRGYELDNSGMQTYFAAGGVCASGSYSVWKSSENGGVLNLPSGSCVSGLVFDRDTIIPGSFSISNPLVIYNSGSTTVFKGAKVNQGNPPLALRIMSSVGSLNIGDPANTYSGSTTYAAFQYSTNAGSCRVFASATLFGSLTCNTVTLANNSITYLDLGAKNINAISPGSKKIWASSYVEEL